MINRYKAMLIQALVPVAGFSNLAQADEISVKEFSAGTVISSADVNSNFDILAKESNENDARLTSLEGAEVAVGSSTRTLVFAGYTNAEFVRDNYGSSANFYTTSLHCKQEFGDSASILTTSQLVHFIQSGNTFTPLESADGLLLVNSDSSVLSAYWDFSDYLGFGVVTPNGGVGTDRVDGSRSYTVHSIPIRVGCVTLQ
jgi:hypothetical protein